ncbi:DUF6445 family protein [Novosphingobium sp. ZN18A2]|uniref:DUF6445 family protein n=1 Tax=Novosphingobium sp. ZN18A2 TaxID=3079861 RepID=UPI0030D307F1
MHAGRHISIETIGAEAQPVIVIDAFVPDPQALAQEAAALRFGPMGPYYPGLRAAVPTPRVATFVAPVAEAIAQTFGVNADLGLIEAMYSLVTTSPAQLRPIQRLPHFDGCEPERLALLHFLGGCEGSGTAFYRHRATGFETVDKDRLGQYETALRRDVAENGMPGPAYIAGDTPVFERIARFEGRFNRALIYRGQSLHCADIAPDASFSADPRFGRLTVNTFLMGVPT